MRWLLCCWPRSTPLATRATHTTTAGAAKAARDKGARFYQQSASSVESLRKTAEHIKADNAKVVVMAGAGVSVSAGIPDFRTPGTGLYDNLQEYGLPFPEAIFDLGFYRSNPRPFQRLCKELWPGNFAPTPTHAFMRVLHEKGKLLRVFTQNIDTLERQAGLPADAVVAAHGNFDGAHVVGQGTFVPVEEVKAAAFGGEAAWDELTQRHGGLVKPDIVFFGEQLPRRFFMLASEDLPSCTLLLVMGTSLAVQPFASLVGQTAPGTARVLINRQKVGHSTFDPNGFDFDSAASDDAFFEGDTDDACRQLAAMLGWADELQAVLDATAATAPAAADERT